MALIPTKPQDKKTLKKEKRKERRKERKRAQPGFSGNNPIFPSEIQPSNLILSLEKEGTQRTVNMLANRRRQEVQRILDSGDKMGLSKEGSQQLMSCVAKKAMDEKTSMEDLEPSAAKVMAHLSEKTFEDLFASLDARKLGERPKTKEAGEGRKEKSLGGDGAKEQWEEGDNEEGQMAPEPVTP